MQPENLPDYPLDPVSAYGSSNQTVNTDAEPVHIPVIAENNQGKPRAFEPPTAPVYLHKLPRFPQEAFLGESKLLHRVRLPDVFYPWPCGS